MGWSNWILIPKLKLLIETTRQVKGIEEYRREALEKIIGEDEDEISELDEVKFTDVTLRDLATLYFAYDKMSNIAGIEYDSLFLFWLEHRNIDYKIESEFQMDIREYKKNGYMIMRLHGEEEAQEEEQDKEENEDKKYENQHGYDKELEKDIT